MIFITVRWRLSSEIISNINYYIIDFPLDYFAFYASRIASCIGNNRSTFTDIVYDQQDVWKKLYKSSDPESRFEVEDSLINYAIQLGHSEMNYSNVLKMKKCKISY